MAVCSLIYVQFWQQPRFQSPRFQSSEIYFTLSGIVFVLPGVNNDGSKKNKRKKRGIFIAEECQSHQKLWNVWQRKVENSFGFFSSYSGMNWVIHVSQKVTHLLTEPGATVLGIPFLLCLRYKTLMTSQLIIVFWLVIIYQISMTLIISCRNAKEYKHKNLIFAFTFHCFS